MAKIHTESVVITFSKLIKDQEDKVSPLIVNDDLLLSLSAVAEELADAGLVVEVDRA